MFLLSLACSPLLWSMLGFSWAQADSEQFWHVQQFSAKLRLAALCPLTLHKQVRMPAWTHLMAAVEHSGLPCLQPKPADLFWPSASICNRQFLLSEGWGYRCYMWPCDAFHDCNTKKKQCATHTVFWQSQQVASSALQHHVFARPATERDSKSSISEANMMDACKAVETERYTDWTVCHLSAITLTNSWWDNAESFKAFKSTIIAQHKHRMNQQLGCTDTVTCWGLATCLACHYAFDFCVQRLSVRSSTRCLQSRPCWFCHQTFLHEYAVTSAAVKPFLSHQSIVSVVLSAINTTLPCTCLMVPVQISPSPMFYLPETLVQAELL